MVETSVTEETVETSVTEETVETEEIYWGL